jgi:hypothetical protein
MNYVRSADLGFNNEAIMMMPAYSDSANIGRLNPLKEEFVKNPDILSVSFVMKLLQITTGLLISRDQKNDADFPVFHKFGDEDYIKHSVFN